MIALLTLWLVRPFFKANEARARERLAQKFRGAVGKNRAEKVHPVSDDIMDNGTKLNSLSCLEKQATRGAGNGPHGERLSQK
jgi:hypothetical protein